MKENIKVDVLVPSGGMKERNQESKQERKEEQMDATMINFEQFFAFFPQTRRSSLILMTRADFFFGGRFTIKTTR